MEEWKEYKISDICSNITSGGTPKSTNPSFYNGTIPWLNTKEVNFNRIYSTEKYISQDGYDNSSAKWIPENSVIVAMYGATAGKVAITKINLTTNQACCNLTIDPNKADYNYVYYFLNNSYTHLSSLANGGAQQNLNANQIKEYTIKLPPLPTQQKIAAILSSLDDKIELNNKINENLEQQAQALFKSWFVDFEPFGGKIPDGWKEGKLKYYCNFQEGYVNPAQTHNEYFDGNVKWLRAVDINESFIIETSRTLTQEGFESAGKSAFLFKPGSIAISKSGTVGRLGIISDYMCGNRAVIGIELKDERNLPFVHQYLKSRQKEFPDMAVGSVQKNLYVSIMEDLDILIPDAKILNQFSDICNEFYEQIKNNCYENYNLSILRDTLLPKLMNGEFKKIYNYK